jgi:uncharacterized membrane protein
MIILEEIDKTTYHYYPLDKIIMSVFICFIKYRFLKELSMSIVGNLQLYQEQQEDEEEEEEEQ